MALNANKGQKKANVVCFHSHLWVKRCIFVSVGDPPKMTGVRLQMTLTGTENGVAARVTNFTFN